MTAFERAEILEKAASILSDKADEAARIIALESAEPIAFARAEVARTIETYKISAEEVKRIHGETIPFDAAAQAVLATQ
ncbi:aldehyde dehydrogenase family protein [Siminovitchia terrae]|uniref:aldehyde dehydrogenase family protein n=1 Tax=Siminovitchia terrae TaxID=1914933 RepID=UPI0026C391CF